MKVCKAWGNALFFALLTKWASLFKVSFIIGSQFAWFSGVNIVVPLSGAFAGITGTFATLFLRMFFGLLFFGPTSLSYLAFYAPGFCASLYWASLSIAIRVVLPAACIMLFVLHPVGGLAYVYALYWLIPIALYFLGRKTIFFDALGSTLVAHAVGSVIWLYTVPTTPIFWLGLIPFVIVERVLFASGMVVMYHVLSCVHEKTYYLKQKKSLVRVVNSMS